MTLHTGQRVFVGSSTEARQRGIVPLIVKQLEEHFTVLPWYETFEPGEYTMDALVDCLGNSDLAVFVFAADDDRTTRGRTGVVTRDNVTLEYGLFTGGLGRSRVAIIQEQDVELPVDVNGMTVARFKSRDGAPVRNDIELAVRELVRRWTAQVIDPPPCRMVDAGLGFAKTLDAAHARVRAAASHLWKFEKNRLLSSQSLEFDSKKSCVTTYAEALGKVQQRFWTTTFLSSGFWTDNKDGEVIQANKDMMTRLAQGGDVRRLFLIHQPIQEEVAAFKEHQILDRKLGRHGAADKRSKDFQHLKDSINQLLHSGCRLRVVHDGTELHRLLPDDFKFKPCDSELAVYDNNRLDLFDGGSTGRISGVRCYTPAVRNFPAYLHCATEYFDQLWNRGTDIGEFVVLLQQAYESADARIDYESQWLAFYEFALRPEDQTLKTIELKRVEEILRALRKWGALTRCLDIGTCTGRYPIFLRQGLAAQGVVIGIDDDMDCLRYAAANVAKQCENDPRISIQKVDFTAPETPLRGQHDVITCMLGTLSHFGRGRERACTGDTRDLLQRALERMASLLAPDGVLILSTWSELACATRQMLGIYREAELRRLAEWTPSIAELHTRLAHAGLEVLEHAQPDVRLDLTVCRRSDRHAHPSPETQG